MGVDLKRKYEPGVKMEEIRERETQTAGGNECRSAVVDRAFAAGRASFFLSSRRPIHDPTREHFPVPVAVPSGND